MKSKRSRPRILRGIFLVGVLVLGLTGCTSGPTNVSETYYLKDTNGKDNAYLRIKVASTLKAVPPKEPVLIRVADAILGSIGRDKRVFGGMLGHLIDTGIREFELAAVDWRGGAIDTQCRPETLAPDTTVSLSFES